MSAEPDCGRDKARLTLLPVFTPFLLLGIVFATIGIFVAFMGADAMRRGEVGRHKTLIVSGLFLAALGLVLGVI